MRRVNRRHVVPWDAISMLSAESRGQSPGNVVARFSDMLSKSGPFFEKCVSFYMIFTCTI